MNTETRGLFPPYKAPPHEPRHPLQDGLYHLLADYRTLKTRGSLWTHQKRRAALDLIRMIKGRAQ